LESCILESDGTAQLIALSSYTRADLVGCVIRGTGTGPIFQVNADAVLNVVNCTITDNDMPSESLWLVTGNGKLDFLNCILWNDAAGSDAEFYSGSGSPSITYSSIQDGWAGVGNISADPLFLRNPSPGPDGTWGTADDDYGDLRLSPASPAAG
jgi:hypothetical protein